MTPGQFRQTLARAEAPELPTPLQALWWAAKGEWDRAHKLVQDDDSAEAAWVHAYLHRAEGDLDNAGYWYARSRRPPGTGALDAEWDAIVTALVAGSQ